MVSYLGGAAEKVYFTGFSLIVDFAGFEGVLFRWFVLVFLPICSVCYVRLILYRYPII